MKVVVVVLDPLAVLADLDDSPELLLNRLRRILVAVANLDEVSKFLFRRKCFTQCLLRVRFLKPHLHEQWRFRFLSRMTNFARLSV